MLNLKPLFLNSVESMKNGSRQLQINPLPTVVYMIQKDVINHYEYAVSHYFNLTLEESFLQNSSLGTPYQKWQKIVNDNFYLLFCNIKFLVTFSSRLFHESELRQRIVDRNFDSLKSDSNIYTDLICDIRYKNCSIGISVNDDCTISVNEFSPLRVETKIENWSSVKTSKISISDRSELCRIQLKAMEEIAVLKSVNSEYSIICKEFNSSNDLFIEYDNLNESFWV